MSTQNPSPRSLDDQRLQQFVNAKWDDEIVKGTLLAKDGKLVHPSFAPPAPAAPAPTPTPAAAESNTSVPTSAPTYAPEPPTVVPPLVGGAGCGGVGAGGAGRGGTGCGGSG